MTFPIISIDSILTLGRTFTIKCPQLRKKKISPLPPSPSKPETDLEVRLDKSGANCADITIESRCNASDSSRVTFDNKPEIHYYESFAEFVDHSMLYYTTTDFRRFEVEADMEDTLCKLEEAIQAMQKRKSTGAVDDKKQSKREELLRKVAKQYCLRVH